MDCCFNRLEVPGCSQWMKKFTKGERSNEDAACLRCNISFVSQAFASNGFAQNPPKKASQDSQKVSRAEAPLTNADVVKLMKLDLGDEIVIAKINQAKAVNFELSTDGLIQLKRDGVSKEVISAMLKMTTPQTPAPTHNQAPAQSQAPSQTIASSTPASSGSSTNSSDLSARFATIKSR